MKKTIAILLAALMVLASIACGGKKSDSVVGTWELTDGEGEEAQQTVRMMLALGMTMTFTFNEDGTGVMGVNLGGKDESENFTYTLEEGKILIDGSPTEYRLDGGRLYLNVNGTVMIFGRK